MGHDFLLTWMRPCTSFYADPAPELGGPSRSPNEVLIRPWNRPATGIAGPGFRFLEGVSRANPGRQRGFHLSCDRSLSRQMSTPYGAL